MLTDAEYLAYSQNISTQDAEKYLYGQTQEPTLEQQLDNKAQQKLQGLTKKLGQNSQFNALNQASIDGRINQNTTNGSITNNPIPLQKNTGFVEDGKFYSNANKIRNHALQTPAQMAKYISDQADDYLTETGVQNQYIHHYYEDGQWKQKPYNGKASTLYQGLANDGSTKMGMARHTYGQGADSDVLDTYNWNGKPTTGAGYTPRKLGDVGMAILKPYNDTVTAEATIHGSDVALGNRTYDNGDYLHKLMGAKRGYTEEYNPNIMESDDVADYNLGGVARKKDIKDMVFTKEGGSTLWDSLAPSNIIKQFTAGGLDRLTSEADSVVELIGNAGARTLNAFGFKDAADAMDKWDIMSEKDRQLFVQSVVGQDVARQQNIAADVDRLYSKLTDGVEAMHPSTYGKLFKKGNGEVALDMLDKVTDSADQFVYSLGWLATSGAAVVGKLVKKGFKGLLGDALEETAKAQKTIAKKKLKGDAAKAELAKSAEMMKALPMKDKAKLFIANHANEIGMATTWTNDQLDDVVAANGGEMASLGKVAGMFALNLPAALLEKASLQYTIKGLPTRESATRLMNAFKDKNAAAKFIGSLGQAGTKLATAGLAEFGQEYTQSFVDAFNRVYGTNKTDLDGNMIGQVGLEEAMGEDTRTKASAGAFMGLGSGALGAVPGAGLHVAKDIGSIAKTKYDKRKEAKYIANRTKDMTPEETTAEIELMNNERIIGSNIDNIYIPGFDGLMANGDVKTAQAILDEFEKDMDNQEDNEILSDKNTQLQRKVDKAKQYMQDTIDKHYADKYDNMTNETMYAEGESRGSTADYINTLAYAFGNDESANDALNGQKISKLLEALNADKSIPAEDKQVIHKYVDNIDSIQSINSNLRDMIKDDSSLDVPLHEKVSSEIFLGKDGVVNQLKKIAKLKTESKNTKSLEKVVDKLESRLNEYSHHLSLKSGVLNKAVEGMIENNKAHLNNYGFSTNKNTRIKQIINYVKFLEDGTSGNVVSSYKKWNELYTKITGDSDAKLSKDEYQIPAELKADIKGGKYPLKDIEKRYAAPMSNTKKPAKKVSADGESAIFTINPQDQIRSLLNTAIANSDKIDNAQKDKLYLPTGVNTTINAINRDDMILNALMTDLDANNTSDVAKMMSEIANINHSNGTAFEHINKDKTDTNANNQSEPIAQQQSSKDEIERTMNGELAAVPFDEQTVEPKPKQENPDKNDNNEIEDQADEEQSEPDTKTRLDEIKDNINSALDKLEAGSSNDKYTDEQYSSDMIDYREATAKLSEFAKNNGKQIKELADEHGYTTKDIYQNDRKKLILEKISSRGLKEIKGYKEIQTKKENSDYRAGQKDKLDKINADIKDTYKKIKSNKGLIGRITISYNKLKEKAKKREEYVNELIGKLLRRDAARIGSKNKDNMDELNQEIEELDADNRQLFKLLQELNNIKKSKTDGSAVANKIKTTLLKYIKDTGENEPINSISSIARELLIIAGNIESDGEKIKKLIDGVLSNIRVRLNEKYDAKQKELNDKQQQLVTRTNNVVPKREAKLRNKADKLRDSRLEIIKDKEILSIHNIINTNRLSDKNKHLRPNEVFDIKDGKHTVFATYAFSDKFENEHDMIKEEFPELVKFYEEKDIHNIFDGLLNRDIRTEDKKGTMHVINNPSLQLMYDFSEAKNNAPVNDNVALAISIEALSAFNRSSSTWISMDSNKLSTFLNISEDDITPAHLTEYANKGIPRVYVADTIGRAIINQLGLKPKDSGVDGVYEQYAAGLGMAALLYLEKQKMVEFLELNGTDEKTTTPMVKLHNKFIEYDSSIKNSGQKLHIATINESKEELNAIADEISDDSITNYPRTRTKKHDEDYRVKVRNNPLNIGSKTNTDAIVTEENRVLTMNTELIGKMFGKIGSEKREKKVLKYKRLLGWKDIDELKKEHTMFDMIEAQKGLNRSIDDNIDTLLEHYDRIDSDPKAHREIMLDYFLAKSGRTMTDPGVGDYQGDKHFSRFLFNKSDDEYEIEIGNYRLGFKKAIAQSFGMKFEGKTDEEINVFADEILKTDVAKLQQIVNDYILDPDAKDSIEITVNGKEISLHYEFIGQTELALDTLIKIDKARKDGNKSVKTTLTVESDGKTNGPAFKIMQIPFPNYDTQISKSKKTGVFYYPQDSIGDKSPNDMFSTMDDLYEDLAKLLGRLTKILEQTREREEADSKSKKASSIIKASVYAQHLLKSGYEFEFVEDNGGTLVVTKDGRDIMKFPLMKDAYGSGSKSIAIGIGNDLSKEFLNTFTKKVMGTDNIAEEDVMEWKIIKELIPDSMYESSPMTIGLTTIDDIVKQINTNRKKENKDVELEVTTSSSNMRKIAYILEYKGSEAIMVQAKSVQDGVDYTGSIGTAIRDIFSNTYGMAAADILKESHSHFHKANNNINNAMKISVMIYNKVLDKKKEEFAKANDKSVEMLTIEDMTKIRESMIEAYPAMKTPLSSSKKDGVGIFQNSNDKTKRKSVTVALKDELTITGADGETKDIKSTKSAVVRKTVTASGSAGGVLPIHTLDGAIMSMIMEGFDVKQVFDALVANPYTMDEIAKRYNKLFYELNNKWNIYDSALKSLQESIEFANNNGFDDIVSELNNDNKNASKKDQIIASVEYDNFTDRGPIDIESMLKNMEEEVKINNKRVELYSKLPVEVHQMVYSKEAGHSANVDNKSNIDTDSIIDNVKSFMADALPGTKDTYRDASIFAEKKLDNIDEINNLDDLVEPNKKKTIPRLFATLNVILDKIKIENCK
jgi:hypothetical protein